MKTSFKKKQSASRAVPFISGTQPSLHNGQLLCSTGVPSLDAVIGGGIPVGSVFALEEDSNNQYANILTRYFLAEGVISNHELLIMSNEDKSCFLNHLPDPILVNEDRDPSEADGDMEIAWRYRNLARVQTSMGKFSKYGHYYDIGKVMDKSCLERCKATSVNLENAYRNSETGSSFHAFKRCLKELNQFILDNKYDIPSTVGVKSPMKILRIAIPSFASPFWGCDAKHIAQFLNCLRMIVRNALAVCWITVPGHIHPQSTVQLISHNVDTVIRLEAFGSNKAHPLYKEYHGLLNIVKLPALNCLLPYMPDTLDLAFKLRRKKFTIERLHLPPNIGETASRQGTEDDNFTATGCSGGTVKSTVDF